MKRLNLLEETSDTLLNEIIVILLAVTYLQINEVINTVLDEGIQLTRRNNRHSVRPYTKYFEPKYVQIRKEFFSFLKDSETQRLKIYSLISLEWQYKVTVT